MRATYSKYILHKVSKPATYIWVRLIIGCVQYTLKYGSFLSSLFEMPVMIVLVLFRFIGSRAILSGPAGGVVGYALTTYSKETGSPVIGFDMGGK